MLLISRLIWKIKGPLLSPKRSLIPSQSVFVSLVYIKASTISFEIEFKIQKLTILSTFIHFTYCGVPIVGICMLPLIKPSLSLAFKARVIERSKQGNSYQLEEQR